MASVKLRLQISANPIESVDTREEFAKIAGVSHDTIATINVIEQKATAEIKISIDFSTMTWASRNKWFILHYLFFWLKSN